MIVQTLKKHWKEGVPDERVEPHRPLVLGPGHGRPRGGRRQERLPRRDGLPARRPRGAGARRVRHHRRGVPPLHRRHRARRAHRRAARRARHRRRTPPRRGRHRDPGRGRGAGVPRGPRGRRPRGVRRARRGVRARSRRSRSARRATAEDLPDASFAGQQETFLNVRGIDAVLHRDPRGVRLALQRPGDRLPRAPRLRARRGRAVGRRAADGALRHRRLRGHVHDGHRVRLHRRRVRHLGLRPRRGRRAGGGQPRRVLRLQARAARRAARGAQARGRRQGDQDGLHRRRDGRPDHRVRRRRPPRTGGCSASPTTRSRSWPGTRWSSRTTTAGRWTSSGARTASTGRLYVLQARPETVQSRATGALERYKMPKESVAGAEVLVEGRAIGQKIGAGAVRVLDRGRPDARVPGRARCSSPT